MLKKKRTAYSLLELSIVITIISILISGAMTAAVGNIASAKTKVTKDRMKVIYNALGAFIATNGRLPCPANITLTKSNASYGLSAGNPGVCSGASSLVYGMVPAASLGLSKDIAEDGFESKIVYVVDKDFTASADFTQSPDFSQTNFSTKTGRGASGSDSNITVYEKRGGATITTHSDAVFILISYGANRKGAYGINSATANAGPNPNNPEEADESENSLTNFDQNFISVSDNSDSFDDIITTYSNAKQMVATFDLYRLLPCNNSLDANYNTNAVPDTTNDTAWNAWFGQIVYGKACLGTDFDKNYTKKCGPNGRWILINNCPPAT
ncbi:MAG: prepilin-type N-terminal cleavage/methylation domain-containing protein [Proteobacteria bacterium]|nr:prepilin-type N-terminal cleavage/methylation domain-containing protein [Pseudomonadota bacterium]